MPTGPPAQRVALTCQAAQAGLSELSRCDASGSAGNAENSVVEAQYNILGRPRCTPRRACPCDRRDPAARHPNHCRSRGIGRPRIADSALIVAGRNRGFTLIELLVVLVILGLLAGIVVPQVLGYVGRSKTGTAEMQIEQLGTALDLYRLDVGRYPSTDEGLEVLVDAPAEAENWNGPYLKRSTVPDDPWGRPYRYRSPGEHGIYDLYTLGADGAPGGDSENEDVTSW